MPEKREGREELKMRSIMWWELAWAEKIIEGLRGHEMNSQFCSK